MYQCNTPNNLKTNVISLFLKNIISSDLEKANLIRFLNFVYKPHVFYLNFLFLRLCMCSWFYNKTHHLLNWGHDTSKVRITRNNTQPMIHAPKENRNCWRVYLCMTRESILLTDRLLFCSLFFFVLSLRNNVLLICSVSDLARLTQKAHTPTNRILF